MTHDSIFRLSRFAFQTSNKFLNKFGVLLSKPEIIHGSPAFSGATLWARRLNQMKPYYSLIKEVDGEIMESGVHWGYGLLIHLTLVGTRRKRKIFGFDSFLGHSEAHEKDYSGGKYKPLDSSFKVSEDDVWRTLMLGTGKSKSELQNNVELIPGWIQETMPTFKKRARAENTKLALVHADCDIYEPFKSTLENSWSLLSEQGIIVLGMLNNPELMGKTKAIQEFLDTLSPKEYELLNLDIIDNGGNIAKQSYLKKIR